MVFGSWRGWGDADSRLRWLIGQLDQSVHVEDEADPAKEARAIWPHHSCRNCPTWVEGRSGGYFGGY